MAHSQNSKHDSSKYIVQEVHLEETVDDVMPPAPEQISVFNTTEEWLINICDSSKPKKSIQVFEFGLFESNNEHILFLVGKNTYRKSETVSRIRIEFEPTNNSFKLPESEYKGLTRLAVMDRLTKELQAFAKTEKFKQSFLGKADKVVFSWNGQVIR